jgi:hypothetical protein
MAKFKKFDPKNKKFKKRSDEPKRIKHVDSKKPKNKNWLNYGDGDEKV